MKPEELEAVRERVIRGYCPFSCCQCDTQADAIHLAGDLEDPYIRISPEERDALLAHIDALEARIAKTRAYALDGNNAVRDLQDQLTALEERHTLGAMHENHDRRYQE